MSNLSHVEFEQLKSLISGRTLSTGEQNITLDILRSKFSNFFSNLGLTEANLKDDKFLIKYLTNSQNRNKIKNAILKESSLSLSQQTELVEALETKPVVTEEEGGGEVSGQGVSGQQEVPVGTTTGASAGGMPGIPSGPSFSPAQRRIYRVSRQEPPKPEIHIANKSGYVTEAGDSSKLVVANKSGVIQEAPPQSKLVVTNASGVVTEPGEPSKLVTTSGGVVKEAPPSKIFIANSSGAVTGEHSITPPSTSRRFNFRGFKTPNFAKNLSSSAQRFTKTNLGKIGRGLGGIAGGGGKALGRIGLRAADATTAVSKRASTGNLIKGPSKKFGLFSMLGFMFLLGALTIFSSSSQPISTTPQPSGGVSTPVNLASCKFTRSGTSLPIKSSSLMSWISNAANQAAVPAAMLASIAMHENPGFVTTKGDDAPEIQTGQYCVDGSPVCVDIIKNEAAYQRACTSEEEQTGTLKTARAKGLMQLLDIYNEGFPFCDLNANIQRAAETLKGKMGSGSWSNETDIKKSVCGYFGVEGDSCKYPNKTGPYDYATEAWQDLQNCQASSAPGTNIFNCPVRGGKVSYGSKEKGEHCSPSYVQQYGSQGCNPGEAGYTGRDTAVDIAGGTSPSVYLPTINDQKVTWNVAEASKTISDAEGGGQDFVATAFVGGKQYRIRFVHLESIPSDLTLGSQAESDRKIGEYYKANPYGAHVHVTIQENGEFKPVDTYFNLCP